MAVVDWCEIVLTVTVQDELVCGGVCELTVAIKAEVVCDILLTELALGERSPVMRASGLLRVRSVVDESELSLSCDRVFVVVEVLGHLYSVFYLSSRV